MVQIARLVITVCSRLAIAEMGESKVTSGYPFGRRKPSGISHSGGLPCLSDGGDGFAVYSVREKLFRRRGVVVPLVGGGESDILTHRKEDCKLEGEAVWQISLLYSDRRQSTCASGDFSLKVMVSLAGEKKK